MIRLIRRWVGYEAGYEACRARCAEIIEDIMRDEMFSPLEKHNIGRTVGNLFLTAILVDRNPNRVLAAAKGGNNATNS